MPSDPPSPRDIIGGLVAVAGPRVSPDGTRVAYVVTRVDVDANRYRSRIWLAPADGSAPPLPLTSGEHNDANPCWSPDGRQLAFTSRRGGREPERESSLHLISVDGPGEAVTLAAGAESFASLAWSPDGRWLAFTQRTRAEGAAPDDPSAQPPRRITTLMARLDNEGWTLDRPLHIYVVPTDGSAPPRNLTPGEAQYDGPSWFPDSARLVATAAAHPDWDLDLCTDLYVVHLDAAAPLALTHQRGDYTKPAVAPDGDLVAFAGLDDPSISPQNGHLAVVASTGGEHRWLTRSVDRTWTPFPYVRAPIWTGPDALLGSLEDRGRVHLYQVTTSGDCTAVVTGDRVITAFDAAGGTVAFAASVFDRPAELYTVIDGVERQLTSVTTAYVARVAPRPAEHFLVPSAPGVEVDAWIMTPPGADTSGTTRYPCLLNVHGGPFTQYGVGHFDEAQLQAAAGFVVLMSNPRGGSGREEAWGQAIMGPAHPRRPGTGWGSVDVDDVMAVMDEALRRYPFIDPDRVGMLGGSYGGYMATWLAAHTDRFRAICSERAANNLVNLESHSDVAGAFWAIIGPRVWEDPEEYRRMSPITFVQNIHTPMLLLHSEADLRCPIGQADELFVALRQMRRDVEYHRFPAESHELTRSGSPVHRVQRADIVLEYFQRALARTP